MIYRTVMQTPSYRQMSLEEFLFEEKTKPIILNPNLTNTLTKLIKKDDYKYIHRVNPSLLKQSLKDFNEKYKELKDIPREKLYNSFHIPKKSGGLRKIDAPTPELMTALRELKFIFESKFEALYHTSAFAYVRGRSTVDAIKRHQANNSKWFAKYDISDFFGSTTLEYVLALLSKIFPFSEVTKDQEPKEDLKSALELAFLNGGLPQGTPISPLITNLIMIPIDFALSNQLRNFNNQKYIYTRYADDFTISSRYTFNFKNTETLISNTFKEFNAPFELNYSKTRYGSSSGSNWNLGLMLNKDNEITVGHKKKRQFQAMLSSYIMDKKNSISWDLEDVQAMEGLRSYYKMVEGETIDRIVEHISNKFKVDVLDMIKQDLKS